MDHHRMSSRNGLVAQSINRASWRRRDDQWIERSLNDPSTRFVPLRRTDNCFTDEEIPRPVFYSPSDLGDLRKEADSVVFLGTKDERAYFALDLPPDISLPSHNGDSPPRFRDLKGASPLLRPEDGALLAYARAMTHWHQRNRFCSNCGSPSKSASGGHVRICVNPECAQQHFPRTDPAIIVLVASEERCLLGRQAIWPDRMYSTLAGFVEPGETLEAAVIREVQEETGVFVQEVQYHSSQPWPFPASIMLGFTARAGSEKIKPIDHELQDARWFTCEEMARGIQEGSLRLPTPISIAYRLIEDWFDSKSETPLKTLLAARSAT